MSNCSDPYVTHMTSPTFTFLGTRLMYLFAVMTGLRPERNRLADESRSMYDPDPHCTFAAVHTIPRSGSSSRSWRTLISDDSASTAFFKYVRTSLQHSESDVSSW